MKAIKPYWHDEESEIEIYCGDTLDVLRAISGELSEGVQAVVTDPPYASGARTEAAKATSGSMVRGQEWAAKPIENDQMTTTGFVWLVRQLCYLIRPMLVQGGHFISFIDWRQWPNLVGAVETTNLRVQNMVVWDKQTMGLGNGFRLQHELILHATNTSCAPYNKGTPNILRAESDGFPQSVIPCRRDTNEWHPSPKPVELMKQILPVVSSRGGLVIDPFMGAGSTLVAAKALGRRAIGIELKPEYCDKAIERLAQGCLDLGEYATA